ncbi:MAG: hypothetical protein JOZ83_17740 [Silvibacterium sp.]|nr:hypothetical protein [Silvibacterium sp.]
MKRFGIISLLVLAGFCTAGIAQAQTREVRAKVPFDFVVAGKTLPAGDYRLYAQPAGTILIRNTDQGDAIYSMTRPGEIVPGQSSVLVFYKYGDSYFLREIHCTNISVNANFPESKQEKQIHDHVAWLGPDTVLLALNGN